MPSRRTTNSVETLKCEANYNEKNINKNITLFFHWMDVFCGD